MPDAGACTGPIARSQLRLQGVTNVNGGCTSGQVLYYKDGDSKQPKCGTCIPGTSGADDPKQLCALNEYCSDNGECIQIKSHPLWAAQCPYEPSTTDPNDGFCGPGLRCYNHQCLPCVDGMIDYADGKVCVMNQWTYNKWQAIIFEPTPTLLVIMLALCVFYAIVAACVDIVKCIVKRRQVMSILKQNGDRIAVSTEEYPSDEDEDNDDNNNNEQDDDDNDDDEDDNEDDEGTEDDDNSDNSTTGKGKKNKKAPSKSNSKNSKKTMKANKSK